MIERCANKINHQTFSAQRTNYPFSRCAGTMNGSRGVQQRTAATGEAPHLHCALYAEGRRSPNSGNGAKNGRKTTTHDWPAIIIVIILEHLPLAARRFSSINSDNKTTLVGCQFRTSGKLCRCTFAGKVASYVQARPPELSTSRVGGDAVSENDSTS